MLNREVIIIKFMLATDEINLFLTDSIQACVLEIIHTENMRKIPQK